MPTRQGRDQSLNLPRILCLHGGGSNAKIFQAQCRVLRAELSDSFRFVFVNAPFASEPGPDVTSVYKNFGPYRRWLRSGPHQPDIDPAEALEKLEDVFDAAITASDKEGATGDWVAVLGFSQGAKMAASLLLRQQLSAQYAPMQSTTFNFRFAVLLAGRGPLVSLDADHIPQPGLLNVAQVPTKMDEIGYLDKHNEDYLLTLPTIHMHGLADPGLVLHRAMLDTYCVDDVTLIEWDGAHRVPIKSGDVEPLVHAILDLGRATGVL